MGTKLVSMSPWGVVSILIQSKQLECIGYGLGIVLKIREWGPPSEAKGKPSFMLGEDFLVWPH